MIGGSCLNFTKDYMKRILFLMVVVMLAAVPVLSQTKKKKKAKAKAKVPEAVRAVPVEDDEPPPLPPPVKKKSVSISNVFKEVKVGKHGVAGLQIPDDLADETESEQPTTNKNVSWTNFSRHWKKTGDQYPYTLEVDLSVTIWNNELKEVIPDLKPELATPENLILIDIMADERNSKKPGSFVKESKAMDVDGVGGGFFRADAPADNTRFMLGWFTVRYHEGKPQRIGLTVTGAKTEMEKALKIIEFLRLQK